MTDELFDRAAEYDQMLHQGLRLSGEDKTYFIEARLARLRALLPAGFAPKRVLDFGCGNGDTSGRLHQVFAGAEVVGVDVAREALAHATGRYGQRGVAFFSVDDLGERGAHDATFDLCYSNGAFHHIPPAERPGVVARLWRWMRPGGVFALFENNPLNPGTRLIMSRVPFDRDAQTLRAGSARRILEQGGFELIGPPRYLFVFPAPLRRLRVLEPSLERAPLGGQYLVLARRPV